MTVVLGVASKQFCFVAADSARYDLILEKPLPPVQKVYVSDGLILAKAGAGSVVDPSLDAAFREAIESQPSYATLWKSVTARLEDIRVAQMAACEKNGAEFRDATFALVAGLLNSTSCDCRSRSFPKNIARKPLRYGILVAGPPPETEVKNDAAATMSAMLSSGSGVVNLAHWAAEVIALARARSGPSVDFPIDCALLSRQLSGAVHRRFAARSDALSAEADVFGIHAASIRRG